MRLREEWRGSRWPQGGWPYRDERTGMFFDPNHGDMRDKIPAVQKHRRANPHIYPPHDTQYFDPEFIRAQIEEYMCRQKPQLCGDGAIPYKPVVNVIVTPTTPCSGCGAVNYEAEFCKSCGGSKIQNFKCKDCGTKV